MEKNFTPLEIGNSRSSDKSINTVLLLIATLTTLVMAILLFLLIQKRMREYVDPSASPKNTPNVKPSPTNIVVPTLSEPTVTPNVYFSPAPTMSTPAGILDTEPVNPATNSSIPQ